MTSARTIIGNYCFKKSTKYILDKCNLLNAKQLITYSAIKFIHKTITNKLPKSNYYMYLPPNKRTNNKTIRTKVQPKTKKLRLHVIHKGADLLNNTPAEIRNLPMKKFSKQLRLHITTNDLWDPGEDELEFE